MSEDDSNAQKESLQIFRKRIIAEDHFKNCFLKAKYKEMRPTSRLVQSCISGDSDEFWWKFLLIIKFFKGADREKYKI